MQAIREAGLKKDLQELDALTHHLRSSWEILRADQPLRELYKLLHSDGTPEDKTIGNAVKAVLDKGSEIIRLAKEESHYVCIRIADGALNGGCLPPCR